MYKKNQIVYAKSQDYGKCIILLVSKITKNIDDEKLKKDIWFTIEVKTWWITIMFVIFLLILISRFKEGAIFEHGYKMFLTNATESLK